MDREVDLKIEVIKWGDAESIDQWESIKELKAEVLPSIYSVGWVLRETKDVVVLCCNFDKDNDKASCIMLIPKKMITKRWKISNAKTKKSSPKSARSKR